ncbi:DUF3823 domain-containing protein [Parabacteroides sp. OttesenSCG-928-N08]|nr:DUF3823 domain-containing protein [Parabacteroides sp. OttesenSCG-928-N08]
MKKVIYYIAAVCLLLATSCEYDNYDAPSVYMSGKLTHNGQNFLYEGSRGLLRVYQKGFGKQDGGTSVRVDHNGDYQQLLFPGDYWLTLENNPYPFEFKDFKSLGVGLGYDSIYVNLKSNYEKTFEVTPYYNVTELEPTIKGNNIVLRFKVTKNSEVSGEVPATTFARGYLSTSAIVNGGTLCSRSKRAVITDSGEVEIEMPIFDGATSYRQVYQNNYRTHAYCRVSIELKDIPNYYLFSDIKKIESVPLEKTE